MGRELQKKKNRSSTAKVKHKPKSKKQLLSNPIIAANWNSKQTLSQNYRRLGLTAKLNHVAGGIEKSASLNAKDPRTDHLAITSKLPTTLEPDVARIERDPETGAIVRVIEDGGRRRARADPLNDPLSHLDDDDDVELGHGREQDGDTEWIGFDNEHASGGLRGSAPASTAVVEELEERAASGGKKPPRKQSEREREWIRELVEKYGDDYRAMSRDRKLNVMQQSGGDIRRRIRRWKESS